MGKSRLISAIAAVALAFAGVIAAGGPADAAPAHHHRGHHHRCPPTQPQPSPGDAAAAYVQQQLGKPYVFGATGPDSFDAPGLVVAAYASVGITLPHGTAQLAEQTTPVTRAALLPGDVVFYGTTSPTTVATYIGNDQVVGVYTVGTVVHVSAIDFTTIASYGRVAQP
jgi:peptidoglycan DL-endopeptidase CwlO